MNEPYYSFSAYLKKRFPGRKIRKIPLNAGFPCPNKTAGGCIFCDLYGSGAIDTFHLTLPEQIKIFSAANPDCSYISYLQANTNTAAPLDELRQAYNTALRGKNIVGLFVGTRPDSIGQEILPLLDEFNRRTYFSIELGLQSIHESSLEFLNRGHTYEQFLKTFANLMALGIAVIVHLIIGLPGESEADILATAREMNRLRPAGVKIHLFHVLKDTPLYEMNQKEPLALMSRQEYINTVATFLEHLDPEIVIHRLTGERDQRIFHAPQWALKKQQLLAAIRERMRSQNTFQGAKYRPSA